MLRKNAKLYNFDLYPSYPRIIVAKTEAYPNDIIITKDKCEVNYDIYFYFHILNKCLRFSINLIFEIIIQVKLQSLLNHTAQRLLKTVSNELYNIGTSTTVYCKCYDGL
jgi:hypothetical protein